MPVPKRTPETVCGGAPMRLSVAPRIRRYHAHMQRALAMSVVLMIAAPWLVNAQRPRPTVLSRLVWFDRSGMRLGGIGPVADHGNIELSPDGTRVAVAVTDRAVATRDI